jgi:hypothetical protein
MSFVLLHQVALLVIPSISIQHSVLFSRVKESLTTDDESGTFLQKVGIKNPTTWNYPKEMHVV